MGKKKNKSQAAAAKGPDGLKEAGNKCFLAKDFDNALKYFTEAIEQAEGPQHVYYANRGNTYLEMQNYQ
jgi:tetratricopeptide (TPR) repeat protein